MTYLFFSDFSKDSFEKYMAKHFGVVSDGGHYSGKCIMICDEGQTTICIYYGKDPSVLAHEIFHACAFTMDLVGIDIRSDVGEAGAYLMGHLFDVATRPKRKLTNK